MLNRRAEYLNFISSYYSACLSVLSIKLHTCLCMPQCTAVSVAPASLPISSCPCQCILFSQSVCLSIKLHTYLCMPLCSAVSVAPASLTISSCPSYQFGARSLWPQSLPEQHNGIRFAEPIDFREQLRLDFR